MKKLIFILAFFAIALSAKAQIQKGTLLPGGNFSFLSSKFKDNDRSSTDFSFNPSVGYFVSDRIAVGLGLGYRYQKNINDDKINTFNVFPFVRGYKMFNENLGIFGELAAGYGWGKEERKVPTGATIDRSVVNASLRAGGVWLLGKRFGLDFSLGLLNYSSTKLTGSVQSKASSFGAALNFGEYMAGLRYFIGKKE